MSGSGKSDVTGLIMARKIAETAATRDHRLGKWLVEGTRPVTTIQFDATMAYLARCPERNQGKAMTEPTGASRYFEGRAAASPEYQAHLADARSEARAVIGDIPAGFFATPSRTGSNDLDFWKVRVSEKSGFRSVARVVGGGDSRTPRLIEISKQEQKAALGAILRTGISKAQEEYADKEERCMKCGRQLTDDDSRARRMGDWCAGKE